MRAREGAVHSGGQLGDGYRALAGEPGLGPKVPGVHDQHAAHRLPRVGVHHRPQDGAPPGVAPAPHGLDHRHRDALPGVPEVQQHGVARAFRIDVGKQNQYICKKRMCFIGRTYSSRLAVIQMIL